MKQPGRALIVATVLAWIAAVPGRAEAQKRDAHRITRQEIESSPHTNLDLYQVIRSLRPHFLEVRGVRSVGTSQAGSTPLALYVDGKRGAGVQALRAISPGNVEEVRYLSPTAATNEFGPHGANGAVIVKLKKRPPQPEGPSTPPRD